MLIPVLKYDPATMFTVLKRSGRLDAAELYVLDANGLPVDYQVTQARLPGVGERGWGEQSDGNELPSKGKREFGIEISST